jgi:hypothetical protein
MILAAAKYLLKSLFSHVIRLKLWILHCCSQVCTMQILAHLHYSGITDVDPCGSDLYSVHTLILLQKKIIYK